MTLVIDAPAGYESERRYIYGVVLSDWLGLDWQLRTGSRSGVRISLYEDPAGPGVELPDVLFSRNETDGWASGRQVVPSTPLRVVDLDGNHLPVVLGAAASAATPVEDDVRFEIDVFGSAFFMLTRYEEAVVPARDQYDRFPGASSLAARAGLLGVPIVDVYVESLWKAFSSLWPRLRRRRGRYEVLLTHDVDDPLAVLGRGPLDVARQFAADLVHRRDLGLAGRRARSLVTRMPDHASDPHNTFDLLMDVSERHGLRSAFYLQAHREPDFAAGANYSLEHPWIRALLRRVHDRGHEVGYHAGFGTYLDADRTAAEFAHLRAAAERAGVHQDRWGGRQHYLQWTAPTTWRNWDAAGLDYDCTVAYADAVGFRTGTCRSFRAFDVVARRPLELHERPFQVMDVTLFGYLGLSPDDAAHAVLRIAAQCQRFDGALGILWHNDSVLRTAREKRWYAELVAAVTSM